MQITTLVVLISRTDHRDFGYILISNKSLQVGDK